MQARIALGFLIAAAALAVAVWLHAGLKAQRFHPPPQPTTGTVLYYGSDRRAAWQDPLAVFLAIAGTGVGLAIVLPALRRRA